MRSESAHRLTVYQTLEGQLAIQKKKGTLVGRDRIETLVFRPTRQEEDTRVNTPGAGCFPISIATEAGRNRTTGLTIGLESAATTPA